MWRDFGATRVYVGGMDAITETRVEVNERSLADLLDLASRAADELQFADMTLSDALHGAVAMIQIELAGK